MPPLTPTSAADTTRQAALTPNNFNLIRLVAAFQVAFYHAATYSGLDHQRLLLVKALNYFPGVPIFFFVSGFLISYAYERNPNRLQYFRNRVLRLYPALIACTALTLAALVGVGYVQRAQIPWSRLALWFASQTTIVQFYNPEFFRSFGVGVVNGALWTICVEVQFYCAVPFLYALVRRARRPNAVLAGTLLVCLVLNRLYVQAQGEQPDSMLVKLAGVTFLPWFYMFLTGVLVQRNRALAHRWLAGRAPWVAAGYVGFAFAGKAIAGWSLGNFITPAIFFALACCVYSVAFSARGFSDRFIKADLSYGLYIFHMPVINVLIFLGLYGGAAPLAAALGVAFALAALSWHWIEKPALALKRRA